MNCILACHDDATINTDNLSLLFTFYLTAAEPSAGRHKVLNVTRWALYLSSISYTNEHAPGEMNTMADITAEWMLGYRRFNRKNIALTVLPVQQIVAWCLLDRKLYLIRRQGHISQECSNLPHRSHHQPRRAPTIGYEPKLNREFHRLQKN